MIAFLSSLAVALEAWQTDRGSAQMRARHALHISKVKLERAIQSDVSSLVALASYVRANPDLDQPSFARFVAPLVQSSFLHFRHIALAKDLIVTHIFPLEGNQPALGLEYSENERQREQVLRAALGDIVTLAGPLELVQGGQGLIVRFPVRIEQANQKPKIWGLISAVIDPESLYADAGLDPALFALRGPDGTGHNGKVFWGKRELFNSDNMLYESVSLPRGEWIIATQYVPHPSRSTLFAWATVLMILIATGARLVAKP